MAQCIWRPRPPAPRQPFSEGRNGRRKAQFASGIHDVFGVWDNGSFRHEFYGAMEAQLPRNDPVSRSGSHSDIPLLSREACSFGGRRVRVDCRQCWLDRSLPPECCGNIPHVGVGCRFGLFRSSRREATQRPIARRLAKGFRQEVRNADRSSGNTSGSTTWLQTKVFFQALGRNFIDEFKPGGCVAAFAEGADKADFLGAIPPGQPIIEDAIKGTAATVAANYAATQALTVPLRSSVVRGILATGETAAAYVAPVYLLGLTVSGAIAEGKAIVNGTCH